MFSDKVFQIAFLISLITHGVILFQNPNLNLNLFHTNKKEQALEVSYIKSPPQPKEYQKAPAAKKEPLLKLSSKITIAKTTPPPPFTEKENIFLKNKEIISPNPVFNKPAFIKPDIIAIKKKITLPPIDADKINSPFYISYYQIVREKIRRAAYQNYSRVEVGEAYLCFIVSSDGSLKEMRLVEEKSSPNPYLRDVALRSIKEASPFPSFPKELSYPQLSFNVIISFEVE